MSDACRSILVSGFDVPSWGFLSVYESNIKHWNWNASL